MPEQATHDRLLAIARRCEPSAQHVVTVDGLWWFSHRTPDGTPGWFALDENGEGQ